MKKTIVLFTLVATTLVSFGQTKSAAKKPASASKPVASKFGALAIDRSNGFYYGWSFDYATLAEAENKAIEECNAKGGNCTVVLSYSGTGCAAYRTIDGEVGTAFGWGLAKTKAEADAIATKECLNRSNGITPNKFVYSCNSANTGILKEIFNASGEIVATIKIGNQIWTNKNLAVTKFRNGDLIPEAKTNEEWVKNSPAWCYYDNNPENGKKYGLIYNWAAVNDSRGIAPIGWHVSSDSEWTILVNYLGGELVAGAKIKSNFGWLENGNGTNESGFNALPGFARSDKGPFYPNLGKEADWWTSTQYDNREAWSRYVSSKNNKVSKYKGYKSNGFYVRCVKD